MKITDYDSNETVDFMECLSCEGMGYFEVYYTEYDLEDIHCESCDGEGIIEC